METKGHYVVGEDEEFTEFKVYPSFSCKNCGVSLYRYYVENNDGEKVPIDQPAVVALHRLRCFVCVICGRKVDLDTGEVYNEGEPPSRKIEDSDWSI